MSQLGPKIDIGPICLYGTKDILNDDGHQNWFHFQIKEIVFQRCVLAFLLY